MKSGVKSSQIMYTMLFYFVEFWKCTIYILSSFIQLRRVKKKSRPQTNAWRKTKHKNNVRRKYVLWSICIYYAIISLVIQIKICAEYWDTLPRPRLVCQEPGLWPIAWSPGLPDKSSRGLGSMSRYSALIWKFQLKNQANGETLSYLWVILLYSSLDSRLIPAVLEGQVRLRLFWNWLGQEPDSCHIAVKLEFVSIFQTV